MSLKNYLDRVPMDTAEQFLGSPHRDLRSQSMLTLLSQ